jgi:tryptophan synthase beta chain
LLGTVAGPHPYPAMIRDFHSVIGKEAKAQILKIENRLPNALIACIGGGSNSIGLFHPFIDDKEVEMFGVEAGGLGIDSNKHSASITAGSKAVLHGNLTYFLQNDEGQILDAHSISAGLDYPGIGPEHSYLHSIGRINYVSATDKEALNAFKICTKIEGIIPALEPSHAIAFLLKQAPKMPKDQIIIANLCGRGDKDIGAIFEMEEFADLRNLKKD